MPTGVTFDAGTGLLSGTPAIGTNGSYLLVFKASNGVSPDATQNFVLTVSASLTNGAVSLPVTGQTGCWDAGGNHIPCASTGQDGELRRGVAWPTPRFADNADGTITDQLTGLIWAKNANPAGTFQSWGQALDYIKSLNNQSYLGHTDWRLPNIAELKSLVNAEHADQIAWLTESGFGNLRTNLYWSSSCRSTVWTVDFGAGGLAELAGATWVMNGAWPVRGGESGSVALPKTGVTTCYDPYSPAITSCGGTGQDGELQQGIAWPEPRFTDNGDLTMTDNLTGLNWAKNANEATGSLDWQQALDHIKALNNQNYLGHNDWRLPNLVELRSLVNVQQSNIALWLESKGFTNLQAGSYWSSNSSIGQANTAWSLNLQDGTDGYSGKAASCFVWPVRGGDR